MTDDGDRFSWNYKPKAQRLEPATLAPPLWTLTKNGHTATAHVKAIDGVGLELRFMIDGRAAAFAAIPRLAIAGAGGARQESRLYRARMVVNIIDVAASCCRQILPPLHRRSSGFGSPSRAQERAPAGANGYLRPR
jgi:hypothetical protein